MAYSDHAFTAPTLYDNAYSGVLSFLSRRFTRDLAGVDVELETSALPVYGALCYAIARAVRAGIAGSAHSISCAPCIKRAREHSGYNEAR